MSKKLSGLAVPFVALALAACGAGSVGAGNTTLMNGTTYSLPAVDSDLAMTATVPKDTIGEDLPAEGVDRLSRRYGKRRSADSRKRNARSPSRSLPEPRSRFITCPRALRTRSTWSK